MSDSGSSYLGKKFSCPGCQSSLKFSRPPSSMLYRCPSCRRKLRIQERQAAAENDELVKQAIDALVDWKLPDKSYDYRIDPKLDRVDKSTPGVLKFNQPWPGDIKEIVFEKTEVVCNPHDTNGAVRSRREMIDGEFRRVDIYRTGQVEEMAVNGHWWQVRPQARKVGILPRSIVRELNRMTNVTSFAARINSMHLPQSKSEDPIALFIDVAIAKTK